MIECSVYDLNLNRIGVIETWVSLIWEEAYNTDGVFQLEIRQDKELLELLKPDRYCGLTGHDTLMVIKSVQTTDGNIVVNGFPATHIFYDRVSTTVISNQNAETAMRSLVTEMYPYPRVQLGNLSGLSDVFTPQKSDATLLDYFQSISQNCGLGFKLRHDKVQKLLLFEVYKRGENPNARYSTAYGNMGEITHSVSTINYKNVAIVAGAGEGESRVTVIAGDTNSTGAERREMYVDARSEQPESEETAEAYKARLISIGEERLIDQIKVENISFLMDDDRAQLGDIVFCYIPEIGVNFQTRVVAITESSQNNVITKTASIGTPIILRRY